jgi:carboxyl-terminal processing protease
MVEMRSEPRIQLGSDATVGGLAVDGEKYTLSGVATDKNGLRDLYIFVNDQKVFFESAREVGAPIRFTVELPLKPGNNPVVVVAREDQDFMSRRALIIHRRSNEPKASKPLVELPINPHPGNDKGPEARHTIPPEGGVLPTPTPNP